MKILSGKNIAEQKMENLKKEFEIVSKEIKRKPILAIVQVGKEDASNQYIRIKKTKAEKLGINVMLHKFNEDVRQRDLLKKLDHINENADGIIIQLPLPKKLPTQIILDSVRQEKDIDGLSTKNTFNFYNEKKDFHFAPATALAIIELFKYYKIDLKDKRVAIVGRSSLVGKPTAFLIKKEGAVVSTYNKNSGIKGVETADIVVVATGQAKLIKKENLKEDAIVIDVGANWVKDGEKKVLIGDVDHADLDNYINALAPVPGGVGPLTVVFLFENLLSAIKQNNQL